MPEGLAATIGPVVLLVQDDVAERALTAKHLRESGFDVVEATDGSELARVVDARRVDVVLADLESPSQWDSGPANGTNGKSSGLHVLRWMHERHPHIRAILASAAEADVAALKGYGVFLSKPYRMVDLDHCLQRVLVVANRSAGATSRAAMEPGLGRRQASSATPSSPTPSKRPVAPRADGGADDVSGEWMAALSRQLGARAAQQQEVDKAAAKAARRAALQAYDRARERRVRLLLGFAIGAVIASALVIFLGPMVDPPSDPLSATTAESSPAEVAAAQPPAATPPPVPSAPPEPVTPPQLQPIAPAPPQQAAAASPPDTANREPAATPSMEPRAPEPPASAQPNPARLARDEVREVQSRLRSMGFNPGPIDGDAGSMTTAAAMHYQQARGQSQTGLIDRDLLAQLREDPTPQPAPHVARADPPPRAMPPPGPRRSDPFEPVRAAGDRFSRWLNSLVR
jgi:CheY-like chemotaxis protein